MAESAGEVRNPFVAAATAERYHRGRPYHHQRTLGRVLQEVPSRSGVAVDVAAGTGLSTRALAALGFSPVGVEPVMAMVVLARRTTGLPYVIGSAEALPVASRSAGLVSVGSAVHWFDQTRFFEEAQRVLQPDGAVIIYDHAGIHLPDDDAFATWARTIYAARYPAPARGSMAASTPHPTGFDRSFAETWVDAVTFTHETLVDYLMTQSNVVDAIETAREPEDAVRSWLAASTAQFFTGSTSRGFAFFAMAEALLVA